MLYILLTLDYAISTADIVPMFNDDFDVILRFKFWTPVKLNVV